MDQRLCHTCHESKSIAGVWYLLSHGAGRFVCGTCYHERGPASSPVHAE